MPVQSVFPGSPPAWRALSKYRPLCDHRPVLGQCIRPLCAVPKESDGPDNRDIAEMMPFSYQSSNGRRKASLEDAMSRTPNSKNSRGVLLDKQPWTVGWQVSERNLTWNNDLASRLVKRVAAEQMQCSEAELEQQFLELVALLPGIYERMHTIKADRLAQLLRNPADVAERLIQLKGIFPKANVDQMVLRDFDLLQGRSAKEIHAAANSLREILPRGVDIDRLCQEHPSMLQVDSFKDALAEAKRLMPELDITHALNTKPEIIFSLQRHKAMIPYDEVPKAGIA